MQYSIVMRRDIENTSYRLDAEYYQPVFLQAENKLKSKEWDYLSNLSESIKSFGAYSLCNQVEYLEKGVPFLRCKDIKNGRIDFSDVLFVSHDSNRLLWKSEVKPKTVLFTMSGTVGNCAIATEEITYPINSNQDIAKIVTNERLNPYFFSVFLQSSYGEKQVYRLPVGSVQQHIFLWQLEKLVVPVFHAHFQNYIEHVFKLSLSYQRQSIDFYNQAQSLLLSELGLSNWQPKHRLHFVKNYSDSEKAGRIDAEYFQPKYDEIVKAIKSYPGGWDTLGNLVKLRDKHFDPKDKVEYKYIELSNIAGNGEITDCMVDEGQDLPSRARRKVVTGDLIVSSIEGSLSSVALIEKEYEQALCSTGFHVINSKAFNSETLLVFLKSMVGQLQLKKGCSGTILTAINKNEFNKVILPKVDVAVQSQIQQKVTESFNLRKQSKLLLECAKRAVEIAIEQNEDKAIKWLQENTKEAGHGEQDDKRQPKRL
jgi:restriction endonuclease S subunit